MIVVIVRTLNEEHRIGQFCNAYERANKILVADGGSTDSTLDIASCFSNVEIKHFDKRVQLDNGYWRNPDGEHANFLCEWAYNLNPDWIIYDDCDCRPNYLLKKDYIKLLYNCPADYVMVTRLYLWGLDQHLSYLAKPAADHQNYEPSLWAWRGNQDFWFVPVPPAYTFRIGDLPVKDLHSDANTVDWFPPYCLMHFSWDDPVRVEKKVQYYRDSGFIPGQLHPLNYGSPLEPLPEWAIE